MALITCTAPSPHNPRRSSSASFGPSGSFPAPEGSRSGCEDRSRAVGFSHGKPRLIRAIRHPCRVIQVALASQESFGFNSCIHLRGCIQSLREITNHVIIVVDTWVCFFEEIWVFDGKPVQGDSPSFSIDETSLESEAPAVWWHGGRSKKWGTRVNRKRAEGCAQQCKGCHQHH